MKTLHIIRNINDELARTMMDSAPERKGNAIVLMHDAVYEEFQAGSMKIYACEEDLQSRQIERPYQKVSHDEIARLVLEYDRAIVW
ncbi:MAG: hypothetical protein HYR81_03875 [Nitrospirae bacterium]|nr:hypothetical protein [Nitrospirota bacterium]